LTADGAEAIGNRAIWPREPHPIEGIDEFDTELDVPLPFLEVVVLDK